MATMVKRLVRHLWHARAQLFRYLAVGGSAFVLDMLTLIALREYVELSATLSVALNQLFMVVYVFTLNKYWSFGSKSMGHTQFVRFVTLSVCNYLMATILMYIFSQKAGFDYRLVRIGSIALSVCWNFLLYKHWVYKEPHIVPPPTTPELVEDQA